jgi:hypothetical protein
MILRSKQIQRLAEMERRVDSGGQPFVRWRDIRMPVSPEVMANLGLRTGQTVSDALAHETMMASLASFKADDGDPQP